MGTKSSKEKKKPKKSKTADTESDKVSTDDSKSKATDGKESKEEVKEVVEPQKSESEPEAKKQEKKGFVEMEAAVLNTPVLDIIPKKQEMIILNSKDTVGKAFDVLLKHNIYSAPVFDDGKGEYIGFLDLVDLVCAIVDIFHETELLGEDFEEFTLEFKEQQFKSSKSGNIADISKTNTMHGIAKNEPMAEAIKIFQNTRVHRIFVIKAKDHKKVINVLTQSTVVSWLEKNLSSMSGVAKLSLKELNIGIKDVVTVSENDKALTAFQLMAKHKVSAVPVVDSEGKLVTVVTAKDLRALKANVLFSNLFKSTKEFVIASRSESKLLLPEVHCKVDAELKDVIIRMAALKVHRIFILDDDQKPIGVLSLGDILSCIHV